MVSMLLPRKTVGFETPSITAPDSDTGSDTDSEDDGSKAMLKKALQMTTRHRMKQLFRDAVQLDRRNTLAFQDVAVERQQVRNRRLAKMKGLGKQQLNIPKMADLVKLSGDKPILKFRRMARAVLLLIQVCNVCKELLSSQVRKAPWFALIDNLIAKSTIQQKSKAPRAFVTFVPNERRELVQLTFDVAEFKRERRTEFILTDEIREMMAVLPGYRTPQQVAAIISVMKALFTFFCHYKLVTQKAIVQHAFFDRYKANRVIVKKGHQPDGIYFILSGCVVEKHEGGKQPKIINAGEKFGEGDLLCGARRRHTVLTKVDTEIFYLHKQDYRVIFDLAEDRNNPKNLDICKQHAVFQHFPMQRLVENPGTWSVHNYKYGQLIALDGNNLDWIYVIKSGEGRVFKYLQPNNIDVKARRRKVQALLHSQSTFNRKKRILSFVEEREYIKSAYHPASYHPSGSSSSRQSLHSAPPSSSFNRHRNPLLSRSCFSLPPTRQEQRRSSARKSSTFAQPEKTDITLPRLVLEDDGQKQSEVKAKEVKDKANDPLPSSVIQETVEELPEGLSTTRSQATSCSLQDHISPSDRNHSTELTDKGERKGLKDQHLHPSETRLVADSPVKRMAERRLSADLTGSLFEKPQVLGEPGRRQSAVHLPPPPEVPENESDQPQQQQRRPSILVKPDAPGALPRGERARGRSASFLKTPAPPTSRSLSPGNTAGAGASKDRGNQVIQVGNHTLPAFVQVETLHPGQVFGLRACLDPEERGPAVSLVSGECEVLQINKKFFMRHCDDAIYSLIRLKNKPFPSEEDLIDRLDVNMQWEEYKQQTLHSFLKENRAAKR